MTAMPPPGELAIEQFFDLPFAEQLVVWAVRLWVHGLKEGCEVHQLIAESFEKAKAGGGCAALDRLMSIMSASALDTIDVRCTRCKSVSPDEHRILGVLAHWQCTGMGHHADALLGKILTPTGVRHAQRPAIDLAQLLSGAALFIRPRIESTTSSAAVAGDGTGASVSGTIH